MAASPPSNKPYSAVSAGEAASADDGLEDYQNGHFTDDDINGEFGEGIEAVQSLDLQLEQDRNESHQRERSFRCKFLMSAVLLAALVFGGREYYAYTYQESSAASGDWEGDGWDGIRGSSNDAKEDVELAEELFEGSNNDPDGMVLDLVGGEFDDAIGGEEEFEGDLDDKINDGEVGGDFDTDMDYDDVEDEVEEANSGDIIDDEEEPSPVVEENSEILEDGEGEETVSTSGLTFETEEDEDGEAVNARPEPRSDSLDGTPSEEDQPSATEGADDQEDKVDIVIEAQEEESSDEGGDPEQSDSPDEENPEEVDNSVGEEEEEVPEEDLPENESTNTEEEVPDEDLAEEGQEEGEEEEFSQAALSEDEDLPDYFVPLTPDEREQMKERLRDTLRATRSALLMSSRNVTYGLNDSPPQRTLMLSSDAPKQFMHMHHMKTGGTSIDGLISCALRRQRELNDGTSIQYSSMSECGSRVKSCMNDLAKQLDASVVENVFYRNDAGGQAQVDTEHSFDPAEDELSGQVDDLNICTTAQANVMSYCASLHAVRTFGWKGVDKITIIRNPVDRAWSMYRFSLTRCYNCREMKDVLINVLNGTFAKGKAGTQEKNMAYDPNDSCAVQMIGHQATNLLSSIDLYNVANDVSFPREKEIAEEAVRNLREEFTWIGITDRIQESVEGIRAVFPFLAENLNDAADKLFYTMEKSGELIDDGRFSLPDGYQDDKGCPFQHRNAGRDPTCGTKEMDDETIALVKRLSNRDVAVYKAAVERFEVQQEVLGEYSDGSL